MSQPYPVDESDADDVQKETVLARSVNFHSYTDADLITNKEAALLSDYCESDEVGQSDLLSERGDDVVAAFTSALGSINAKDTRQYILAVVDKLVSTHPEIREVFTQGTETVIPPLMRLLTTETERASTKGSEFDLFSSARAAAILAQLLTSECPETSDFFTWLIARIRDPNDPMAMLALSSLKFVLKDSWSHERFARDGGFRSLLSLIKEGHSQTQLMYLSVFSLWLLSYSESVMDEFKNHHVVQSLVDTLKTVTREKVVRVTFATLANLLNKGDFNEDMITFGLVKVLETMSGRKWKDEDLVKDLEVVAERLGECVDELTNFDMYHVELNAGTLAWTPVHTEQFWRENCTKFEDGNYHLIKQLISVLDAAPDDTTLEVACYDLGEFARYHPDGRMVIQKMGGKARLMALLAASDKHSPAVQKQALLAVQKLMVHHWDQLSGSGGISSLLQKK